MKSNYLQNNLLIELCFFCELILSFNQGGHQICEIKTHFLEQVNINPEKVTRMEVKEEVFDFGYFSKGICGGAILHDVYSNMPKQIKEKLIQFNLNLSNLLANKQNILWNTPRKLDKSNKIDDYHCITNTDWDKNRLNNFYEFLICFFFAFFIKPFQK